MKHTIKLNKNFTSTNALSACFNIPSISWNLAADLINSFGVAYPSEIKIKNDGAEFKSKKAKEFFINRLNSFQQAGLMVLSKEKIANLTDTVQID